MDPIRIGVIGLRFGQQHVRTLANMEEAQLVAVADRNLRSLYLRDQVYLICSEAGQFLRGLEQTDKQFSFAFIDHSHAYQPVYQACEALSYLLAPGGFCLFHDPSRARCQVDARLLER